MKQTIAFFLFMFTLTLTFAQETKKIDEKYGFRDIKFETNITSITGMKEFKQEEKISYYKKDGENLYYGAAELHEIIYGAYDGKLMFVLIRCLGKENSDNLMATLKEEYDEGHQKNSYIQKYTWFGKTAGMNYEYKDITRIAEVYIYSKSLVGEMRK